jgi:hypothetical protein
MRFLLSACAVLLAPVVAWGADADEARARRARAALALSGTARAPAADVAPLPRPAAKLPYADGHRKAVVDEMPLVVFVSCDGPKPDRAISAKADAPFAGVRTAGVVVGYPANGTLVIDSTLTGDDATPANVQRAVDAAGKKIDGPPQQMPPAGAVAPAPLDWSIGAELPKPGVCVCGDSCECEAKGKVCPGGCTVQQVQAAPRQLTYAEAFAKVKAGHRVTLAVGIDCGTCDAKCGPIAGVANGVYECYLSNGVPTMLPRGGCPLKPAKKVD